LLLLGAAEKEMTVATTYVLFVPDRELPTLRRLARADVAQLQALETALKDQMPTLGVRALARSVADRAGLPLGPLVSVLSHLTLVRRTTQLGVGEFLEALTARLTEKSADEWSSDDAAGWDERKECIARLLDPDGPIGFAAKAMELLHEHQRVLCQARVLADARPIFDDKAESVQAFLPFHTLALTYHEGEETRDIHLAMDSDDIKRLRDHLDRALRKEKLLRQSLGKTGVIIIETGAEIDA
jgi:hypothetical protein